MILEFLTKRDLNISMLSLERESGVINGVYSDDMLFLRQLILDGQWDDVIDFVQPLSSIDSFDMKRFQYVVYRHKYLELLCIRAESGPVHGYEYTVDEVVKCVNTLEQLCPTKEEFSKLCLIMTLPRLSDHPEFLHWNPSNARVQCFSEVYPLIEKLLPLDKREKRSEARNQCAKDDRMIQLLVKGLLYESCVEFCQHKATCTEYDSKELKFTGLLNGTSFSDTDVSLLSWLQAIPQETFVCPFEQKSLRLDIRPLEKPSLDASWSEQILAAPIKPRMFPHSAMPPSRRSVDFMSQSLMPQYDGLSCGLASGRRDSTGGIMSKSFAGFHLNVGIKKIMLASVDKLFEEGETVETYANLTEENSNKALSPHPAPVGPAGILAKSSDVGKIPNQSARESLQGSPKPLENAAEKSKPLLTSIPSENKSPGRSSTTEDVAVSDSSSELYKQYQKQRLRVDEELARSEKQRQIYQQQLLEADEDGMVDNVVAGNRSSKTEEMMSNRGK